MNLIYEKSGVKYHEVHVYRLLHKWGFVPKVAQKRFVNSATPEEKLWFKKNSKEEIASKIAEGFTVLAQDESIFLADAVFRKKMWVKKCTRPVILLTAHIKRQSFLVHQVVMANNSSDSMTSLISIVSWII